MRFRLDRVLTGPPRSRRFPVVASADDAQWPRRRRRTGIVAAAIAIAAP
jgi:hypothetical protein